MKSHGRAAQFVLAVLVLLLVYSVSICPARAQSANFINGVAPGTTLTLAGSSGAQYLFDDTIVNQGTLVLDDYSASINDELINEGKLQLTDSSTLTVGKQSILSGYLNNFAIAPAGAQIDIDGGSTLTVFGDTGGDGSTTLGATQGNNAFLVSTNINLDRGGSLSVEGQGDRVSAGGFNNNGAAFSLAAGASLTVTGGGYGGAYNQSSGTTGIDGSLVVAPGMYINCGTLSGTGTIQGAVSIGSGGIFSPGDAPGTLHISGDLNISGAMDEAIDSASSFSVTDATGQVTLGPNSSLSILLASDFDPAVGTTFTILNFGSLAAGSRFGSISNEFFNNGAEEWAIAYASTRIELTAESVAQTPEPAAALLLCTGLAAMVWIGFRRREAGLPG